MGPGTMLAHSGCQGPPPVPMSSLHNFKVLTGYKVHFEYKVRFCQCCLTKNFVLWFQSEIQSWPPSTKWWFQSCFWHFYFVFRLHDEYKVYSDSQKLLLSFSRFRIQVLCCNKSQCFAYCLYSVVHRMCETLVVSTI